MKLVPAQFALSSKNEEELGQHCLEFTNPEFRELVKKGHTIVVAGEAFGCGSSRQEAVQALIGSSPTDPMFNGVHLTVTYHRNRSSVCHCQVICFHLQS